ncbi:hypothetical protein J6590_032039 [Homalodisca vitripennis]|nr:hypothetical protein J6590_032039 [Homalodisca vitripennis]
MDKNNAPEVVKRPSFFNRHLVVIVMVPAVVLLHWGWVKLQNTAASRKGYSEEQNREGSKLPLAKRCQSGGRPKPKKDEDEKKDKDDESRQSKSFVESSHGESSKKSIWPSSMSLAIPMEYEDLGIDPDDPEPLGQSSSEEDQVNIAASLVDTLHLQI